MKKQESRASLEAAECHKERNKQRIRDRMVYND